MIEEQLIKIAGKDHVSWDSGELEQYARDMSFVYSVKPAYVVKPANSGEVQAIIELANQTRMPVVPVSSGIPHFRGDTIPGTGGSIILNLSRMKKVMRIDRINRVAMCEPGVTFGDLIPPLEKAGIRLNMPLLPRSSKSVIGSMLEREPVTMPAYQWDISDPLDCVEIIFGDGKSFRTGSAAGPGTLEEQWSIGGAQDEPLGPGPYSWHRMIQGSQGTLGVVTWATIRCELLARMEEPFLIGSDSLEKLQEMMHWLIRLRLVNECLILNHTNLSLIYSGSGENSVSLRAALPAWILFFNIAGYDYLPEARIAYQTKEMQKIAQRIGLLPVKAIGEVTAEQVLKKIHQPSEEPYWKLLSKGACEDIFFLAPYEKLPHLIQTMYTLAENAHYSTSNIGIYLQPIVQGTSTHCEFNVFYNPENPGETGVVRQLCQSAVQQLMDNGAFVSRPYGENAGNILNRDAASTNIFKKNKSILDPNNVMNPGKLCY
jgi:FAD/FMN-containing dehydrogenase